jgi:sulfonate transport system substrate-binding protein
MNIDLPRFFLSRFPLPRFARRAAVAVCAALCAGAVFAQAAPAVIRFGSPELGTGDKPFPGANPLAVVKANGWLEQEFAKDGIKVEWTFFRAAGPAVNEAVSAKQLDVVFLGDLASVIGRARGLPTRLIAVTGRGSNSYLAAAPGSGITGFADLKGRKVAVLKGTAYQRPFDALLADAGLTEKDVRLVNMDWPTSKAAVVNKDVDATFGSADLNLLKDKGVTLPVSTKGRGPAYTIFAAVLATDDFATRYPAVTQRIVRQIVRASRWASEEGNRAALIRLWGDNSGQGTAVFQAEFDGEVLKERHSPLIDDAAVAAYKGVVADALRLGLIRQNVDVDAWVAPRFVDAAVRELQLDGYWPRLDARGRPQP